MLKPAIQDLMNAQVQAEFHSSQLYLSMAAYLENENFPGMAGWMREQAKEEHGHGMKFFDQIIARGGRVKLGALEAPKAEWAGPEAVFTDAAAHEVKVTAMINAIADKATAEKDHATLAFLQYFVTEQVEEEATANVIVAQLAMAGGSKGSLMMIDHKLGKRAAA